MQLVFSLKSKKTYFFSLVFYTPTNSHLLTSQQNFWWSPWYRHSWVSLLGTRGPHTFMCIGSTWRASGAGCIHHRVPTHWVCSGAENERFHQNPSWCCPAGDGTLRNTAVCSILLRDYMTVYSFNSWRNAGWCPVWIIRHNVAHPALSHVSFGYLHMHFCWG